MANSKTPAALSQPQPISLNRPTTDADWTQFATTLQQWLDRSELLWKPIGNCVIGDGTLTKQAGASAAWDSGAYSIDGYQTCHIAFKASNLTGRAMAGLSQNPILTTPTYVGIDFGILAEFGGTWALYESGINVAGSGPYTVDDLFSITYDGATVTYYQNSTVLRTSSIAGKTFYGTAALYAPGAGCNSLQFRPGPVIT